MPHRFSCLSLPRAEITSIGYHACSPDGSETHYVHHIRLALPLPPSAGLKESKALCLSFKRVFWDSNFHSSLLGAFCIGPSAGRFLCLLVSLHPTLRLVPCAGRVARSVLLLCCSHGYHSAPSFSSAYRGISCSLIYLPASGC